MTRIVCKYRVPRGYSFRLMWAGTGFRVVHVQISAVGGRKEGRFDVIQTNFMLILLSVIKLIVMFP